jgi:pimeloyl-ACP methyl ester carboxylesterase
MPRILGTHASHRPTRSARFQLVRSTVRQLAVALLATVTLGGGLAAAAPAGAQIDFGPCADSNTFACGHLTVPLDPGGTAPGTITLAIRRRRAPVGNATSAVVALAGGPGQSALPFAEDFSEILGPALSTRDLIVYDQRGTGLSHPLSCHGFEHPGTFRSLGALISACAGQIGSERAFYTTPDSVADIEAIRIAGGYEKLVLYGTSYGTKVALQYAQDHPEHVEALILDSVVTPNGPDPLDRETFAAVPRVLGQLCSFHACAHITGNPVRDLAQLVQRLRRGPLSARLVDEHGHSSTVRVSSDELLEILLAGDFDPILRAEFITSVRAADAGDDAPLARLLARAAGGEASESSEEGIDVPLYYATTCEEEAFPWSRTAPPQERLAQARAQVDAVPTNAFAPFTSANALAFSDAQACAFWPFATPAPPVDDAPLPNVPTLILSGADDLRTPTANALSVAEQIPDAHLLVVPNTGHSVLTTEPTSCAREALDALFAQKTIKGCPLGPPSPILRPPALPPERLAAVSAARGYRGRTGRTLQAIKLTLADFSRQLLLQLLEKAGSSSILSVTTLDTGGLRAGWAQLTGGAIRFHDYTYVPGVEISGTVKAESATLRIGGSAAARGTLRLGAHHRLVGSLAGRHVQLASSGGGSGSAIAARSAGGQASAPAGAASRMPAPLAHLSDVLDRLPGGLGEDLAALPDLWATRLGAQV